MAHTVPPSDPVSKGRPLVRLTKIKQWFLPVDAESYKTLRAAGIPNLRIHENIWPTVKMLVHRHNIRTEFVDFKESILNPAIDTLTAKWCKRDFRDATITASVLKFETTSGKGLEAAKEAIPKLEEVLRQFFARWGYAASFDVSESRGGKMKLHVSYKHDANKSPVIALVEETALLPQIKLELGFVRVTLIMGEHEVEINFAEAAGTGWKSIKTSRCLYSQISDVMPFITALAGVPERDAYNGDNRPK